MRSTIKSESSHSSKNIETINENDPQQLKLIVANLIEKSKSVIGTL